MSLLKQYEHLRIQIQDVKDATNNFSKDHFIGEGGFGEVYRGKLALPQGETLVVFKRLNREDVQGEREFFNEIVMLSHYSHKNIVSLLGFCEDKDEKILVCEYVSRRSLNLYLGADDLTWSQRLMICIGAARGLVYLHSDVGTNQRVVHRDVKSGSILLDENWNAKISGFGFSKFLSTNKDFSVVYTTLVGTIGYTDPLYMETGNLSKESDVYSFGVVLFEVLCGRPCIVDGTRLSNLVEMYYETPNELNDIIFDKIRNKITPESMNEFTKIAYQCLRRDRLQRPSMEEVVTALQNALEYQVSPEQYLKRQLPNQRYLKPLHFEKTSDTDGAGQSSETVDLSRTNTKSYVMKAFEHLRLPLGFIQDATNNFSEGNFIGEGGFGRVFKGELIDSEGEITVGAIKRLDRSKDRADVSFWNEVMLLSTYRHENIISLLGFCDEFEERIIVYELASKKSLDLYLDDPNFTWIRRLKVCLGAACGLEYLHNPKGTQQRVLHRDIKSANILLDGNWNAKIADFGLSRHGPANQQHTFVFSDAKGTLGYCAPDYIETMILTKEADVYSFGVVLFEVLCSRLCVDFRYRDERRSLPILVNKCYQEQTLDTIIEVNLKQEMEQDSYDTFVSLAYQCLEREQKKRPSMDSVVSMLQTALQYQELSDNLAKKVNLASSSRPSSTSDDILNPEKQVGPNDTRN